MAQLQRHKVTEQFSKDEFVKLLSIAAYSKQFPFAGNALYAFDHYLIVYISAGSGTLVIDFKEYPVAPNTLFLIAPKQIHQARLSNGSRGHCLFFEEHFFCSGSTKGATPLSPPFFRKGSVASFLLDDRASETVASLFERIGSELIKKLPAHWEVVRNHIALVVASAEATIQKRASVAVAAGRPLVILNNFIQLVEHHYLVQKGLTFYAAKLGISAKHLTETVRQAIGNTPVELIRQRTLLEARRRLLAGQEEVKVIAYDLGFESTSWFIKLFKAATGLTPSAYREKGTGALLNSVF